MTQDDLKEIDGVTPDVWLADGEEKSVGSKSSKAVYKCKRTFDHYYCTCPAWRNQPGVPVNARSCKHLRSLLGDSYEEARLKLRNPDGPPAKGKAKAKPVPRSRSKKQKDVEEEEPEAEAAADDQEEEDVKPKRRSTRTTSASTSKIDAKSKKAEADVGRSAKPSSSTKPASKATSKRKRVEEDDEEEEEPAQKPTKARAGKPSSTASNSKRVKTSAAAKQEDDDDGDKMEGIIEEIKDDGEPEASDAADNEDELVSIDGVKPKVFLADGEEREVGSQTSNSKYKIKRTWDHYYCSCPAWRNQGGAPVNARTCKHLKELLGEKYEIARLKLKNPHGAPPTSKSKPASKKRKAADDEDGDDDEDSSKTTKKVPDLLLATKWDLETGQDPTGWWVSEKLDGVRAFYDGSRMFSRLGNLFTPPKWFLDALPKDVTLDGELFGGRGQFQSTVSVVKTINSPHWKGISFQVFDVPSKADLPFEDRLSWLKTAFGDGGSHAAKFVNVVEHVEARDRDHVLEKLQEIESLGGEGLMLRKPGSLYEGRRSNTLLKIKTFYDAEALVIGYEPGKGRNKGVTGALKCKMASGKTFNVGTGLSYKQRQNPPKTGAIIVYRFQELTRDGVPRFPSFVGEAADKDEPKDADIPEHRKGGATKSDD